ncbi:MAG TPA: hypothetical protein VMY18_01720, partial [Acidobacteriota bacterium]|nr:hypothetical protein [Acidobacteriota bacterium]
EIPLYDLLQPEPVLNRERAVEAIIVTDFLNGFARDSGVQLHLTEVVTGHELEKPENDKRQDNEYGN